jgi:hypothetical protein
LLHWNALELSKAILDPYFYRKPLSSYVHTPILVVRSVARWTMTDRSNDMMVLRTVYLPASMDTELRDLAHRKHTSKNELIRASIANRLRAWQGQTSDRQIEEDLQLALKFS